MVFPNYTLASGEELVHRFRPHWGILIGPFSLAIGLAAATGLALSLSDDPFSGMRWLAAAVLWVAILVYLGRRMAYVQYMHGALTTDRILWREGMSKRESIEIPLDRVDSVRVRKGGRDRMLGTGTIIMESSGHDGPIKWRGVPRVKAVHALLSELTKGARDAAAAASGDAVDE